MMQSILYNISQVLGITIIHSLWQGLLIYFILRIAFAGISSLTAVKKYNLAIAAMVAITVCFAYTLATEISDYSWVTVKSTRQLLLLPYLNLPTGTHYHQDWYYSIGRYLPYICAFYFMGLIINVTRLAMEWSKIRQIKLAVLPAETLQQLTNALSKKLNITRHVSLKFSELIDVPCMIGYFKPLILLPVSIFANLGTAEVEAILLHELSHIKRNDYLVNLLQQVITVVLFFNPFTQLINRIVNQERENVCDDLVVEKTGEPLIYAQALIKLEEARKSNLQLALAATGQKFQLLNRIERIMKTKKHMASMRHLMIALFLLAGTLSCVAWFNPKSAAAKAKLTKVIKADTLIDSTEYNFANDTTKHKQKGKAIAKRKHKAKAATANQPEIYGDTYYSDDAPDSVKKYFNSPEWRAQMQAMRKQGAEMRKKFDSPEWKSQVEAMRKQGAEMQKKFNSPEWKNQVLAMQKQGEEMRKQFDSPEWKNQVAEMRKQGEEMQKKFNSQEWKGQVEAMKKQGELMKKQFDSPEWKHQVEEMKKQGEEIQKKFNSPEWKNQVEAMKKQGELMKKQFDSPEWKNQMEQVKKQADLMRKQFNSPEWKKQMKTRKWILRDSVGGSKTYVPGDSTSDKEEPVKENQ